MENTPFDGPVEGETKTNTTAMTEAPTLETSPSNIVSDLQVPAAQPSTANPAPSKFIKKRNIGQNILPSSPNADGQNDGGDAHDWNKSPQPDTEEKIAAKKELMEYLARNGVDEKDAEAYGISLRFIKPKGSDKRQDTRFKVYYTAPNGSLLDAKSDVLRDIQESRSRRHSGNKFPSRNGTAMSRDQAHEKAKADIQSMELPSIVDGIKLINLGTIDIRSGFHNCVQLYPVGYKCQQSVSGMTLHKGTFKQEVICEIKEVDGFPQFSIASRNTGTVVIGSSEESAWKQFYPGNIDTDSKLSFFNLDIELLLEGLDGALDCEEYKFHCERGYGKDYNNPKEAISAKSAFVKKMERERRINDRQRLRFLSKEEQDRLLELQRRKEEEDKKLQKDQAATLKQRKGQEQEDFKRNREREKAEEAEKRERMRKSVQEKKESEKAEEKAKREENKRESKVRQNYKKEIAAELKKSRADVTSAVLQAFDDEEKENEVMAALVTDADIDLLPSKDSCPLLQSNTLEELLFNELKPLPNLSDIDRDHAGCGSPVSWNDFFAVANYIHIFKSLLDVEHVANFETVIKCLSGKFLEGNVFQELFSSVHNTSGGNAESKDAMDVEVSHNSDYQENTNQLDNNMLEVLLERIQLHVLKLLIPSINAKLDLDQKDAVDTAKKEKKQIAVSARLPLNQLTWNELARISFIQYLFTEMNRPKDDIQHAVRGSKAGNFRFAKNICRNIRYKWYIRNTVNVSAEKAFDCGDIHIGEDSEDRIPFVRSLLTCETKALSITTVEQDRDINQRRGKLRPCEYTFTTAEELVDELNTMSESVSYPEIYRRCAKVLLRIVKMPSATQFLWEIDQQESPYYYSSILRPIMFANIANNLIQRVYDDDTDEEEMIVEGQDYLKIAHEFYADMKQVVLNCFTYNTELAPVMSSAQKLLQAIYRHVDRWIFAANRPPIDCCDEKCCLLTQEKIVHQRTVNIKCGKCSGAFNLESVENIFLSDGDVADPYKSFADFFIAPTDELVNQANEEWHCPFCLKEDFILLTAMANGEQRTVIDQLSMARSSFFIDEWGPSATIPWIFNPIHSNILKEFEHRESYLIPIVEALQIVSNHQLSCMFNGTFSESRRAWSIGERIKVLKALFVILQSTESGFKLISKLNDDGEKLMKYCSKATFREAEFVSYVKEICGEAGVIFSRKLLDGFDFSSNGPRVDYNSQSLIESRCMLCNASTVQEADEDDENNSTTDDKDNQAILCDGCNGEAHLRCLGMETVPKVSWYCSTCSLRQSRRQKKSDIIQLDHVDHHRDKEEEEELMWKCVERKVKGKEIFRESESDQALCCTYCGLHDISICSPLVYGQSRSEHDHWVQLNNKIPVANHVLDDHTTCTTVNFLYQGSKMSPPKVDYPYFPLVGSKDGQELKKRYDAAGTAPTIAHQLCALHMFQTRVNRSKYEFRKRRKEIGKLIEGMGGAFLLPLGSDTFGNEYWHFPYSDDLFISTHAAKKIDSDRLEFSRMRSSTALPQITSESNESVPAAGGKEQWIRLVETDHIRKLIKLLEFEATMDFANAKSLQTLKINIINTILTKRLVAYDLARSSQQKSSTNVENDTELSSSQTKTTSEQQESIAPVVANSNIPVEMKLNTNKGLDIASHVTIESEEAFDPASADDDDGDQGVGDISAPYFSLSKNKYYAVALLNGNGTTVKMRQARGNDKRTVIYQVRREGYPSISLLEAELGDAWDDHMYYFSSLVFKKSGTYTISFIVQNSPNTTPIKPLVFKVTVQAKSYLCGVPAALNQLRAQGFLQAEHRQIYQGRRELLQLARSAIDEFSAVKAALILLYLALPNGALTVETNFNTNVASLGESSKGGKGSILFGGLLEPSGWNSVLEQTWSGVITNATGAMELMECLLVLEFYLNRSIFSPVQSKLWSALPNAHFAIRSSTLSSVAMRIFCLDKVLLYAKAQIPSREKRGASSRSTLLPDVSASYLTNSTNASSSNRGSKTRGAATGQTNKPVKKVSYREDEDEEDEEEESANDDDEDEDDEFNEEDDEDDDMDRGNKARRSSRASVSSSSSSTNKRTRSGGNKRKNYREYSEEDEFDEDEVEEQPRRSSRAVSQKNYGELSDEEDQEGDEEQRQPSTSSGRKAKRKSIEEDDVEVDFDDDGGVRPVAKRAAPSPELKKPKVLPKKSFEQSINEYIAALSGAVRKFSVDIADFPTKNPDLHPAVIDANMRFLSILRRLKQDERTYLFWNPVDRSVSGYHDIIKNPMDLGTITYRVMHNEYNGDISLFAKDMSLVWSNCKTFNLAGSVLYQYAFEFEQLTARLLDSWLLSKHRPDNADIKEDL